MSETNENDVQEPVDLIVQNFHWSYMQGGEDIRIAAHHSLLVPHMHRREAEERYLMSQNPGCDPVVERWKRLRERDGD